MCVVSMVTEHYYHKFPNYYTFTPYEYPDFQELLRKAKLYDEEHNQKDCVDPEKDLWLHNLQQYMRAQYRMLPLS